MFRLSASFPALPPPEQVFDKAAFIVHSVSASTSPVLFASFFKAIWCWDQAEAATVLFCDGVVCNKLSFILQGGASPVLSGIELPLKMFSLPKAIWQNVLSLAMVLKMSKFGDIWLSGRHAWGSIQYPNSGAGCREKVYFQPQILAHHNYATCFVTLICIHPKEWGPQRGSDYLDMGQLCCASVGSSVTYSDGSTCLRRLSGLCELRPVKHLGWWPALWTSELFTSSSSSSSSSLSSSEPERVFTCQDKLLIFGQEDESPISVPRI